MKKLNTLLTREKGLRMNGKIMTDFLQAFYSVDKRLGQYLLAILFKQRYTSSVESYKHLNKLIC